MKLFKTLFWLSVVPAVCVALGAWTTFDYSLYCTKCMDGRDVLEQHLFGIPILRSTKNERQTTDYERIFGHSCRHVFYRGGFGKTYHSILGSPIGCGAFGEAAFFRTRMEAVGATYEAEARLHNKALALETFAFIDQLRPADFDMKKRRELPESTHNTLALLAAYLLQAQSSTQWQVILDAARKNFDDTSGLPAL